MSKDGGEIGDDIHKTVERPSKGVPHYCDTEAGVLGPYPNDGSVKVGDSCFGTQNGQRYDGTAVMNRQ
jgi:hypothetical protein